MRLRWLFSTLLLGLIVTLLWFGTRGAAASANLPPRPTAAPTQTLLPASALKGGTLALHATFPQDWDYDVDHWQTPWTVIEWQDAAGDWHPVVGWQGSFDHVLPEGERYFGLKTWWVAPDDLGTGLFRWLVYREHGGTLLSTSDSFSLPSTPAKRVVEIDLGKPGISKRVRW